MHMLTPEVTIAFLGETGSGKTTLVTRYSNFRSPLQQRDCQYAVIPIDQAAASDLLIWQKKMKHGDMSSFPKGSRAHVPYRFQLRMIHNDLQLARITWHDYPGGWWNADTLIKEVEETRDGLFGAFINAEVGILVLDASKLFRKASGLLRVREFFEHTLFGISSRQKRMLIDYDYVHNAMGLFANRLKKLAIRNNMISAPVSLPRVWIVALFKADIVGEMIHRDSFNACDFAAIVLDNAREHVSQLQDLLGSEFGRTFLLVSSCRGAGKNRTEYVDSYDDTIGLELIAPLAFEFKLLCVVQEIVRSVSGKVLLKAEEYLRSHSDSRVKFFDILDWLHANVSDKPKVMMARQIAELRIHCFKQILEDKQTSRWYCRVGQTIQEELFDELHSRLRRMVDGDAK